MNATTILLIETLIKLLILYAPQITAAATTAVELLKSGEDLSPEQQLAVATALDGVNQLLDDAISARNSVPLSDADVG